MPSWWSAGAEGVATWGLRTALAIAVLALSVWAVERVLRTQLAPRVRVGLWSLVLIRAVMPFNIPLPISEGLNRWTRALPAPTASSTNDRAASAISLQVQMESEQSSVALPQASAMGSASLPVPSAPIDAPVRKVWWVLAALAVWGVGTLVRAARWISADRRFRRSVLAGSEPALGWIDERVERLAQRMGVTHAPAVRTMDGSLGPAVLQGLVRPTLFLSKDALTEDADALDAVLAHELSHHRGRDRYWMLAVAAVRSVWWFHPAVQWAAARWQHGLELTRDADAIRTLGTGSRVGYARRLLDAAVDSGSSRKLSVLSLGWESATGGAEERIRLAAAPAGATRGARWVGGVAVLGLGAAAVATAASSLQESSIAAETSENIAAGDGDLDHRVAKLEFHAASESAAVEAIAKRYGLNMVIEPGFPLHKLSAKGTDISAREALDFVVRDYTGGFWREERGGVIRLSMPAAQAGKDRTREYDFSSVIENALSALDAVAPSKVSAEEAPEKLRKALLETVGRVLNHAYPDDHHEETMEGKQMRVTAGIRCHEALASLVDGVRSPTPLLIPELSMLLPATGEKPPLEGATVASALDAIAATTGYLIATKGLDSGQLSQEFTVVSDEPQTVLFAFTQISRATQCSIHVGARSVVLSTSEAPTVRVYSAGVQPLFGGFALFSKGPWGGLDQVQQDQLMFARQGSHMTHNTTLLTGVAGSLVMSSRGTGREAMMLAVMIESATLKAKEEEE